MFSVFIFVLGMYAMVPGFRDMVTKAIGRDGDILVVSSDGSFNEDEAAQLVTEIEEEEEVALSSGEEEVLFQKEEVQAQDEDVVPGEGDEAMKTDSSEDAEPERLIVNKEYHEDCGTGKGYWVITYDDGTTAIEQN